MGHFPGLLGDFICDFTALVNHFVQMQINATYPKLSTEHFSKIDQKKLVNISKASQILSEASKKEKELAQDSIGLFQTTSKTDLLKRDETLKKTTLSIDSFVAELEEEIDSFFLDIKPLVRRFLYKGETLNKLANIFSRK